MELLTATSDVQVQGQLLARNSAVTLDTNTIKKRYILISWFLEGHKGYHFFQEVFESIIE